MIEAFTGTLKKKESEGIQPYPVEISTELEAQIDDALNAFNIQPLHVVMEYCLLFRNLLILF